MIRQTEDSANSPIIHITNEDILLKKNLKDFWKRSS